MRIKHFLKLKEEDNQEILIILIRYNLASVLYNIHKNLRYIISNEIIKTDHPKIEFYHEDIIHILNNKTPFLTLKKILKKYTKNYFKLSIKNTLFQDNLFGINMLLKTNGTKYGTILFILIAGQKIKISYLCFCILRQELMTLYIGGKTKNT